MLDALRRAAGTWVAKTLLILLVLSFAVWGISGSLLTAGGNNVLTVGDTRVSVTDYRLAYDRQLQSLSQQFGTRLTRDQAKAFGVDQQVIAQLAAGAVLDEQANRMNLGLSRDRIAALTAQDTAFHGPDGRFNRQQFEYVLRQVGMRAEDYLRNREQVAIRQQIVEAVSDGLKVPQTYLRAMALYSGEDRTVEYIVVPKSVVEPLPEPTDAQLTEFFNARKADYAAPEYRKVSYVRLEPSTIADEASVTDEEVDAYYEKNKSRFTTAERRRIEQLVFADEAQARAARDKIAAGTTFEQAVTDAGKTMNDVLLGEFARDRVADPAIAAAAFALAQGDVSQPVKGTFGTILLRVTAITPEVVRPLDSVRAEIRRDIAVDEASRIITDVHDSYEDARAAGSSLREAAERQKLPVTTVEAVDRRGLDAQGNVINTLPESQALLRDAFESDVGVENPAITLGSTGYLFYEVEGITAARDRTLDEVRDRAIADWKAQEGSARLATRMTELKAELDGGKPLADIASALGIELQTRRGLKRNAGEDASLGQAAAAAAFGVAQGGTGLAPAASDGAQILFKVTEVVAPMSADASAIPAQTQNQLSTGLGDDLLDQLVAQLRGQYEVRINQAAIDQALSF